MTQAALLQAQTSKAAQLAQAIAARIALLSAKPA
jgi:hypothetical protein